jgi:stress response protein YsnF
VPRGQAGVRKRVVTEQQHRTVPVEQEELRVQREPVPAGEGGSDAELAAEERTVELHEEQPVVDVEVDQPDRER